MKFILLFDGVLFISFYVQVAMGQQSPKLHKNEKNTNISHNQMYLPKLHENILKYYRLNLF